MGCSGSEKSAIFGTQRHLYWMPLLPRTANEVLETMSESLNNRTEEYAFHTLSLGVETPKLSYTPIISHNIR